MLRRRTPLTNGSQECGLFYGRIGADVVAWLTVVLLTPGT